MRQYDQRGLSLVELMVALAIGLILSAGLAVLVTNTSKAFKVQDDFARLQENGSAALRYLVDDIRMAGFYGPSISPRSLRPLDAGWRAASGVPDTIDDDCVASTPPWALDLLQPIEVRKPPNATAGLVCVDAANYSANSPLIVLRGAFGRRISDTNGDGSVLEELNAEPNAANTFYVESAPQDPSTIVFRGDKFKALKDAGESRKTATGADAPIFEFQTHVYYVRPCSRPTPPQTKCAAGDDGGQSIPTLVRHELQQDKLVAVPLVEGVEAVNLIFGLDANNDGVADQFTSTPPVTWDRVVSIRVSVLVRTPTRTPGYSDQGKTYDLGGGFTVQCAPGPDCTNYKRHVFSQIASVRNCAQRRGTGASNPC